MAESNDANMAKMKAGLKGGNRTLVADLVPAPQLTFVDGVSAGVKAKMGSQEARPMPVSDTWFSRRSK